MAPASSPYVPFRVCAAACPAADRAYSIGMS
jgi:hypothetical protein